MALEAWEIIAVIVIVLLLIKPSIVTKAARSLGRLFGEYKKSRFH